MKTQKTLPELTQEILQSFKDYQRTGTPAWTYETAVKDLPYQVGSLTKLIMQKNGERFADGKTSDQIQDQIKDELADILSLVLFIAHELNIDLYEAWEMMTRSDQKKIQTRTQ